ncbi:MAG TPA: rod shape-determining protein MreC [Candidatus Alectryocaccomicrobium excrementavium]|uniref:Cell shape-determining protein MreC n=1 Tax=Candidatus Alectryocaccomicrobium excrementavium TaxID=2840668 RepID=A0A9D1FXX3_9FIRM|nr:rod shape-determining protein MreC [Candidatus Alectryocaccomicrobium excrementavium]
MARKKPNFRRPGSDLPRNRSKRLGRWMIGLAVTIGVVLVILFIVSRSAGQVTVAENAAGSLLSPVQNLFSSVTKNVRDWFTNRQTVASLQAANQELQLQVDTLTIQLQATEEERQENDRLRALLEAGERYEAQDPIYAEVIAKDAGVWFSTFTINRGTLHGVSVNNAVITADGLAGRVYEVGLNYAKVRSIIHSTSSVACLIQRTRDNGVLTGQVDVAETDECQMNYLPNISSVVPGDTVVTSGVDMLFPKGLMVGTVTAVSRQTDTTDKYVMVKPAVDFYHLEEVLVLRVVIENDEALAPVPTPSPKPTVTPKVTLEPTPRPGTTPEPTPDGLWSYPTATPAPETVPTPEPTLPEEAWANS